MSKNLMSLVSTLPSTSTRTCGSFLCPRDGNWVSRCEMKSRYLLGVLNDLHRWGFSYWRSKWKYFLSNLLFCQIPAFWTEEQVPENMNAYHKNIQLFEKGERSTIRLAQTLFQTCWRLQHHFQLTENSRELFYTWPLLLPLRLSKTLFDLFKVLLGFQKLHKTR